MASSDDEAEVKLLLVSNYNFEDENEGVVSLSVLPILWNDNEGTVDDKELIYMRGTADNGLQQIYKPLIGWKFDLTNKIPEILVLCKDKSWIRLQKPRKSYCEEIRTILITVHCLSYAKRNPEATEKSIWDALSRVFSFYDVRPSQNDLVDHMDLISEALKRDDVLTKSKFLIRFLEEKPMKRKLSHEVVQATTRPGFIVDEMIDDMVDDVEDDDSNEENEFDSVCSFCDNGGTLLCCDGKCMRSFHATLDAGEESQCVSLGLTEDEVEAIQNFICKNCEYKQHQCFVCGNLGSSDKETSAKETSAEVSDKETSAEVFRCVSATCGYFYHPRCVSKLLFWDDEVAADQLQKSIIAGESFTCPLHKCAHCKDGENSADDNLRFAVCRRCPKAYHRKCLPREIAFEDKEEEGIITRAWEGLLPNHRILIYCLKHQIDDEIGTPIRDHIVFPGVEEKKTVIEGSRKKLALPMPARKPKDASVRSSMSSKVPSQGNFSLKALKRAPSTKKDDRQLVGSDFSMKVKATEVSRKSLKGNVKSVSVEVDRSFSADRKKISSSDRLYTVMNAETGQTQLGKQDNLDSENNKTVTVKSPKNKLNSELPSLDSATERRLSSLIKGTASSVSMEEIQKRHKIPSTHAGSLKFVVDKAITLGKVEVSVEAIRAALKKLERDGSSIEDAKAVCEPEVLKQIFNWKEKLKVYLAPFLHGMRYTSYGRHFTKVEKLQAIVDRLHWYVKDGDTIVDFCCGANDFSCLMKKKLEEDGKKCFYKNFDTFPAKNDFEFERRDWMTIKLKELAPGSQLIMGLNPPFGVKAALANKFINKALQFEPKLLILIVPPETERLDRKKTPYELVWEDDVILSGESFYLPGSVDENDKQLDQWNLITPPLYLWSHCDFAAQHKAVAEKHGHLSKEQKQTQLESNYEAHVIDHLREEDRGDTSMLIDLPLQTDEVRKLRQEAREDEGGFPVDAAGRKGDSHGHGNHQSYQKSSKRKRGKKNNGRGIGEKSHLDRQNDARHVAIGTSPANIVDNDLQQFGNKGMPYTTPANVINGNSSEGHLSKSSKKPSHDDNYQSNEMPNSSLENEISVIPSFKGPSSKPIEMPSPSGISENDYQHFNDGTSHHSAANMTDGGSSFRGLSPKSIDLPSYTGFDDNVHQHFEPTISSSHMQIGTAQDGTQVGILSDVGSHGMSSNETRPNINHGFSHGANLDEQFMRRGRNTGNVGYRPFPRESVTGPTPGYGQMGSLPSHVHGNLGSSAETSYRMSTSIMDRYAPRLGEFNNPRMGGFRPELFMASRSGFYNPRAQQPGYFANMDFDPGYRPPFPHQGSGGWVDD